MTQLNRVKSERDLGKRRRTVSAEFRPAARIWALLKKKKKKKKLMSRVQLSAICVTMLNLPSAFSFIACKIYNLSKSKHNVRIRI